MGAVTFRLGSFETSSSSVSCFAYIDSDAFGKWVSGKFFIDCSAAVSEEPGRFMDSLDAYDISPDMRGIDEIADMEANFMPGGDDMSFDEELLHRGILPYSALDPEERCGTSAYWQQVGGGLWCAEMSIQPDGGATLDLNWYDW